MRKQFVLAIILLLAINAFGQYSQLQLGDTTKRVYPYKLPFMGKVAYEKGFDIPLSAGGMINYFWASQNIVIPEIAVGFNDSEFYDISNIIEFGEISATVTSINVRPDIWIFPFLNLYGIFGKSYATTTVELISPIKMKAVADLEGTSSGVGITGASGLGKYFFVLDGNWVWTKMTNFEDPVQTSTFSFRFGRALKIFKNPQSNIALWAGGMRITMGGITEGSITLNEVLPPDVWERKDQMVADYWVWYDDIGPLEPVKKQIADRVLTPIVESIDEKDGSGSVKYRLKKEPKQRWNMIIGAQYQINKHHQFRVEGGVLGDRTSLLLSYNLRFGI